MAQFATVCIISLTVTPSATGLHLLAELPTNGVACTADLLSGRAQFAS
jgi:hypothetical protein